MAAGLVRKRMNALPAPGDRALVIGAFGVFQRREIGQPHSVVLVRGLARRAVT